LCLVIDIEPKIWRKKLEKILKCPRCHNKHTPLPEDFSHPNANLREGRKIFLRRYGHNSEGKVIECLICLDPICDSINIVQLSILKGITSLFGAPVSPYKPYMNPIRFDEIHTEVNKVHDITKKDVALILNDGQIIPPHIFEFLLEIGLFSIGDLGLKLRGKYCSNGVMRGYAAFSSDEYSLEEMHEKYDVHDRLEEIKRNTNRN